MLCSFYKLILIVSRTINVDMHLKFRLFNALFNNFNVVERIIRNNACSSKTLIIKACELTFTKLAKYYSKIKNKDELIYNLVMNFRSYSKVKLVSKLRHKECQKAKLQ